jgi:exopolysaccharide biosynthesis protein
MASSYHGKGGALTLGGTAVAQITDWSISQSVDTADTTTMGDSSRTFMAGIKSFEGSADVLWSAGDTSGDIQAGEIVVGTTYTAVFYPGGTSGNVSYTGEVICTSSEVTATVDDVVTASISFQGTGDLTIDNTAAS